MYNITLKMQVHSGLSAASSDDRRLERKAIIPFPPFPGLTVGWKDVGMEWENSAIITEVVVEPTMEIICWAGEDKQLYTMDHIGSSNYEKLDEIVAEYVAGGWTAEPLTEREIQWREEANAKVSR